MEVRHSSETGDGLYIMKESCVTSPPVNPVAHIIVTALAAPMQLMFWTKVV